MPATRSHQITETHPVARYLFQAADLGDAQKLTLTYATQQDAYRAAWRLRNFRARGTLAPPGTYECTEIDPKGEGRGYFDHIEIRIRPCRVELGPRAASAMPEPVAVEVR